MNIERDLYIYIYIYMYEPPAPAARLQTSSGAILNLQKDNIQIVSGQVPAQG